MGRVDKFDVLMIYIRFNCRKLDMSNVKSRIFNKINNRNYWKIVCFKV